MDVLASFPGTHVPSFFALFAWLTFSAPFAHVVGIANAPIVCRDPLVVPIVEFFGQWCSPFSFVLSFAFVVFSFGCFFRSLPAGCCPSNFVNSSISLSLLFVAAAAMRSFFWALLLFPSLFFVVWLVLLGGRLLFGRSLRETGEKRSFHA